ncbi:hypothetical protein L218DRAFT_949263 [Marasmius fiardii PR-910]|nr:hypothetical protein L218DRAFT_949263 [Marasmius fiardii PR-910]
MDPPCIKDTSIVLLSVLLEYHVTSSELLCVHVQKKASIKTEGMNPSRQGCLEASVELKPLQVTLQRMTTIQGCFLTLSNITQVPSPTPAFTKQHLDSFRYQMHQHYIRQYRLYPLALTSWGPIRGGNSTITPAHRTSARTEAICFPILPRYGGSIRTIFLQYVNLESLCWKTLVPPAESYHHSEELWLIADSRIESELDKNGLAERLLISRALLTNLSNTGFQARLLEAGYVLSPWPVDLSSRFMRDSGPFAKASSVNSTWNPLNKSDIATGSGWQGFELGRSLGVMKRWFFTRLRA